MQECITTTGALRRSAGPIHLAPSRTTYARKGHAMSYRIEVISRTRPLAGVLECSACNTRNAREYVYFSCNDTADTLCAFCYEQG